MLIVFIYCLSLEYDSLSLTKFKYCTASYSTILREPYRPCLLSRYMNDAANAYCLENLSRYNIGIGHSYNINIPTYIYIIPKYLIINVSMRGNFQKILHVRLVPSTATVNCHHRDTVQAHYSYVA